MCNYLGAETVSIDAAKPRRRGVPALLRITTIAILAVDLLILLAGCDGVTVDLGSGNQGGPLTGNDAPIVEEITWIDMSAEELVANYQQYVGKEVFVRNTVVVSKSSTCVIVGGGSVRLEAKDVDFIRYLAITDTVEARGIVTGLDEAGKVVIENAHINVWFSCYPREHTSTDIGNDFPVQTNENGLDGFGAIGQTGNEGSR